MALHERPTDMVLSPAKEQLLRDLYRYDYLTVTLACRLRYSPGSHKRVQQLLKELADAGYITRIPLPRPEQHGSAPSVFTLATPGYRHLERLGLPAPARFRPSETQAYSAFFLHHQLATNAFLIAAELFARSHPAIELANMVHERELKQHRTPVNVHVPAGNGRRLLTQATVIPDAFLEFHASTLAGPKRRPIALELDRGTEYQVRFRRKIAALLQWAKGPYPKLWGFSSIRICVVTTAGSARLASLLKQTEAELRAQQAVHEASMFRFTACTPEDTDPATLFLAPIWYQPFGEGGAVPLLTRLAS
jgi:hypothetical protein